MKLCFVSVLWRNHCIRESACYMVCDRNYSCLFSHSTGTLDKIDLLWGRGGRGEGGGGEGDCSSYRVRVRVRVILLLVDPSWTF